MPENLRRWETGTVEYESLKNYCQGLDLWEVFTSVYDAAFEFSTSLEELTYRLNWILR